VILHHPHESGSLGGIFFIFELKNRIEQNGSISFSIFSFLKKELVHEFFRWLFKQFNKPRLFLGFLLRKIDLVQFGFRNIKRPKKKLKFSNWFFQFDIPD